MKQRNFLSGLMAAPLALKARILALFARKQLPVELCGAPIVNVQRGKTGIRSPWGQAFVDHWAATTPNPFTSPPGQFTQRVTHGRETYITSLDQPFNDPTTSRLLLPPSCSRPRGHKGRHSLG